MSYPQIPQIRADFFEQDNGSRFVPITKALLFPICDNL